MNHVWISWLAEQGRVLRLDEFRESKERTGFPPAKRLITGPKTRIVVRRVGIPRADLLENWQVSRFRMRLCLP